MASRTAVHNITSNHLQKAAQLRQTQLNLPTPSTCDAYSFWQSSLGCVKVVTGEVGSRGVWRRRPTKCYRCGSPVWMVRSAIWIWRLRQPIQGETNALVAVLNVVAYLFRRSCALRLTSLLQLGG